MKGALGAVLVSSAGGKVPLLRAAKHAAQRLDPEAKVVAADLDGQAPTRFVADDFWQMPPLEALNLDTLIADCRRRDIRTILPTRDAELGFWADAKARLQDEGISVIVSSSQSVDLCLDKLAFSQWGAANHLPIIPASQEVDAFSGHRLVVKERFGAGSRAIGIDLDETEARRHAAGLANPLFQPLVTGKEISIDAWLDASSHVHGLNLRHRTRVIHGESQTTVTFRNPAIEAKAREVLSRLKLSGPVVMQAMMTGQDLAIIEVNARFGGASTASIPVGLDLLYWSLFERAYPERPLPVFERATGDIRQVRVAEDLVIHDPHI